MKSLPIDRPGYYLGILCKRKHEYEVTGKTLRTKAGIYFECQNLNRIKNAANIRKNKEKFIAANPNYHKSKCKEYSKNNKEHINKLKRERYKNLTIEQKEHIFKLNSKWFTEHKDYAREKACERAKKYVEQLTDGIIRARLNREAKNRGEDIIITDDMIKLKRDLILIKRLKRSMANEFITTGNTRNKRLDRCF